MEQDIESSLTGYRHVCSTCLSSDRNLISLNAIEHVNQVFRLLMYDFAGDRYGDPLSDIEHLICWECSAVMKKLVRFKHQVHNAQEQLQMLALSRGQESLEHTYIAQTLSPLEAVIKTDYDKIFFEYTAGEPVWTQYTQLMEGEGVKNEAFDVAQVVRENIDLDGMNGEILEVPVLESLDEPGAMSHIVVTSSALSERPSLEVSISSLSNNKVETVITTSKPDVGDDKKCGYVSESMTESEMLAYREEQKQKVQYASSAYKCELCVIGFYTQQQVEDHYIAAHRAKAGLVPCKVCYVYVDATHISTHTATHYIRYICKYCGHTEYSQKACSQHVRTHVKSNVAIDQPKRRRKKGRDVIPSPPKPGDLRRLLSKTTIEGYKCLECDMFFKNSRSRKNHVARFHREGLQCDHCKKRFVNRTTLATHLKLHEGPLPRAECPVCHKQVRVIQLKYHIQRHENKSRYECTDCQKVFSHLATYQAHLKYSRAHASDEVFKFPCPMCNKGYPTKDQMQDHFNYQHLGKTSHKCLICDKPIASRANVEKHMMRVHGEKRDKPRNHQCQQCGKAFTDKKALTQHEVIHSGERPLSCDICQQTFKQKASLYTHRKRVHKVFPQKRVVEFMDTKSKQPQS